MNGVVMLPARKGDRDSLDANFLGGFAEGSPNRLVQAAALTTPVCWHRGSVYHLGLPGKLADSRSRRFDTSEDGLGLTAYYWEPDRYWGQARALVRLPRFVFVAGLGLADVYGGSFFDFLDAFDTLFETLLAPRRAALHASLNRPFRGTPFLDGIPLDSVADEFDPEAPETMPPATRRAYTPSPTSSFKGGEALLVTLTGCRFDYEANGTGTGGAGAYWISNGAPIPDTRLVPRPGYAADDRQKLVEPAKRFRKFRHVFLMADRDGDAEPFEGNADQTGGAYLARRLFAEGDFNALLGMIRDEITDFWPD